MDEIISVYRDLLNQLNDEYEYIALSFQDRLLVSYREILQLEIDRLEKQLWTLH